MTWLIVLLSLIFLAGAAFGALGMALAASASRADHEMERWSDGTE